ncbi:hypothetical protein BGX38DRAFT_1157612 [Terfezia claveryi]|nr:hypothetical protein BGX38DRAFT_1157612 [Terfezia claveryi]
MYVQYVYTPSANPPLVPMGISLPSICLNFSIADCQPWRGLLTPPPRRGSLQRSRLMYST